MSMLLQRFSVIASLTDDAFITFSALTGNVEPQARDNGPGLIACVCVCANDMWRDNEKRKTSKKKKNVQHSRGWQTYNIRVTLQQTIQFFGLSSQCQRRVRGRGRGMHDVCLSSHKDGRKGMCMNVCACVCVCLCTDDSTSRSVRLFKAA